MSKTKLEATLLTLCDHAMTSQQGKLSIIGLFDRIFVTKLPSKYPRFFIVAIIYGEPQSEHELKMRLISPGGNDLLPERKVKVKFGANGRANVITDVANLGFEESGEFQLQLQTEKETVGNSSFFVTKVNPKQQQKKAN